MRNQDWLRWLHRILSNLTDPGDYPNPSQLARPARISAVALHSVTYKGSGSKDGGRSFIALAHFLSGALLIMKSSVAPPDSWLHASHELLYGTPFKLIPCMYGFAFDA